MPILMFCFIFVFIKTSGCWFSNRGLLGTIKYNTISWLYETCDERWVTQNAIGLSDELYRNVFGQEIAIEAVIGALEMHSERQYRQKPLVISFHGLTGVGKGYVADFIVKHWYKEGGNSRFVKKYIGRLNFTVEDKLHNYQIQLQQELEDTVRKCPRAMFVFDEVDKYIPRVLDGIKPYLDYTSSVNGLDFRESIFIFITNTGGDLIANIAFQKWLKGIDRENLTLADFDNALKMSSYNEEGGLYHSNIIKHHLIDYVVPFLPLEKSHVEACIETAMIRQGGDPNHIKDVTREVIKQLTFGPAENELYSRAGCKIQPKVDAFIEKKKRERRKRSSNEL